MTSLLFRLFQSMSLLPGKLAAARIPLVPDEETSGFIDHRSWLIHTRRIHSEYMSVGHVGHALVRNFWDLSTALLGAAQAGQLTAAETRDRHSSPSLQPEPFLVCKYTTLACPVNISKNTLLTLLFKKGVALAVHSNP
ncbi:hypothetical protein B0T26DRAFT_180266 [Lasiosphaeria miniovina]|uniref:Uncharacterized protein n=1 Tax=Lasiosphaeria miniovina TaxID=1954250 RepID=A0AA40E6C1_9PEZI|nr:uncharacterized protein B0T26DRAFT_180266 [Lasiosphaeria miniovina]KAK0728645.1 hypothetical protein B0T26DRAFT_180266 [Lasiosphaeria miniovina]